MNNAKKKVIVWQSLVCPKCGSLDVQLPPESWEAIEHGTKANCAACKSELIIKLEAVASKQTCPLCFDGWVVGNDGLMHKCPNCNKDGQV